MKQIRTFLLALLLGFTFFGNNVSAADEGSFPVEESNLTGSLLTTTTYDTTLMAFQTENLEIPAAAYNPRANYFTSVGNTVLTYRGAIARKVNYQQISKADLIYEMQSTTIFFIHTHGAAGALYISQSSPYYLSTIDLASVSLSNLKCAVLLACKCGMTVPTSTNMVQTIVNRGAKCALGFTTDVTCIDCNLFAERFAYKAMYSSLNVTQAKNAISTTGMTDNMQALCVIGGNGSTTIYN